MTKKVKPKVVGGMFGLAEMLNPNTSLPPFISSHDICLVNARSGVYVLTELLSPSTVWLPSFLCEVMLKAVLKSTKDIRFYEVDYNLNVASLNWLEHVLNGDLVIFVDYFGFPFDSSIAIAAKERGSNPQH